VTITFAQFILDYFQLKQEHLNYLQDLGINRIDEIDFRVLKKLFLEFNIMDDDQNRILGKYYDRKYLEKSDFTGSSSDINDSKTSLDIPSIESQIFFSKFNKPETNDDEIEAEIKAFIESNWGCNFKQIENHLVNRFKVYRINRKGLTKYINDRYHVSKTNLVFLNDQSVFNNSDKSDDQVKVIFDQLTLIHDILTEKEIFNFLFEGISSFNTFLDFMNLDVVNIDSSYARKYLIAYDSCLKKYDNVDYIRFKLELGKVIEWIQKFNDISDMIRKIFRANYKIKLRDFFIDELAQFFSEYNIFTLKDLSKYNYDEKIHLRLYHYQKKLISELGLISNDIRSTIKLKINEYFQNKDKETEIILLRFKGKTLEEIGKKFSVTRERIRQIEKRAINKLDLFFKNNQLLRLIQLSCGTKGIIDFKKIDYLNQDQQDFITFYLKRKDLIVDSNEESTLISFLEFPWISYVYEEIDSLGNHVDRKEIKKFIKRIQSVLLNNGLEVDNITLEILITEKFSIASDVYIKDKQFLGNKYSIILKNYFPNGLHVYNHDELEKFRKKYLEIFNDATIFEKSDRTVLSRITDKATLIDRGVYTHPDNVKRIPSKLLERIKHTIEINNSITMYKTLFSNFEVELTKFGVNNRYLLQGLLSLELRGDFITAKDYIAKTQQQIKFRNKIYEYIESTTSVFTTKKLLSIFSGISINNLVSILSSNEEVIYLYYDKWIYSGNIIFSDKEIKTIKDVIEDLINEKGFVHYLNIYDRLLINYSDIINKDYITSKHDFFSVLSYLFKNDYSTQRPFLARKNHNMLNRVDRVKEYVYERITVYIPDMMDYINENHLERGSILDFINSLYPDYYRVSYDIIVKSSELSINEIVITKIKNIISSILNKVNSINISKQDIYKFLPKISFDWNDHLLASIIYSHINEIKVKFTTNMYNTTEYIIELNKEGQL
jgi:hypothetical protein